MVGQTLTAKGRSYRYYRCRHAYDKNTGHECSARYVGADALEALVWSEIQRVLANPALVLHELRRLKGAKTPDHELTDIKQKLGKIVERERRLLELFVDGTFPRIRLDEEASILRREKALLEERLHALSRPELDFIERIDGNRLAQICTAIAGWLENADESKRSVVLEALQIQVEATREETKIRGVLPSYAPKFITIEQTSA
jgi:site-specific DNA recombinase